MAYVDGFVIVCKKKDLKAYWAMARKAGKVWMEHGALDYKECAGDDIGKQKGMQHTFTKLARVKSGETVIFSWITFKSKAARNSINKKVMQDPRLADMMKTPPPFDMKRFTYGGFKVAVDLAR